MKSEEDLIIEFGELESENKFKESLELLPDELLMQLDSAVLWNCKGRAFYELNLLEKAIQCGENGLRIDNNLAALHEGLGDAYKRLDDFINAEKCYHTALSLNNFSFITFAHLGDLYYEQDRFMQALEFYFKYLEDYPPSIYIHTSIGEAYFELGEYSKARDYFAEYLSRNQDDEQNYLTIRTKARLEEAIKRLKDNGYNEVSNLLTDIRHILLFEDECLTHYTSLEVTQKLILEANNPIRLSEGAFLNDPSEGTELFKLFPSFLYANHELTAVERSEMDTISKPFVQKPFIGSYVAKIKENDLTLWRMYGKDNKEEARGCAITMNRKEMLLAITENLLRPKASTIHTENNLPKNSKSEISMVSENLSEDFNFYRVAYKIHNKVEFLVPGLDLERVRNLNSLIGMLVEVVKGFLERDGNSEKDVLEMKELLNDVAYLFKTEEYIFENEVRLVVKGIGFEKKVDLKFTPPRVYVELAPINPLITQLTLGPKVERVEEWSAAFHYHLENEGYNPNIHISRLPFK
ncbi:tetratricopeptide repeat protein [Dyadobacter sp. 3J3]|uniref:tetratricopeptide repeat protein n=1 Tax=Dyadobacter sp. 3J3 TaxID=2606600 RepID=UPI001359E84A|nr:tetratricopeptide repeat protein [Dyadobacter sp. 3J3]